jgi:hypothetical protein
MPFAVEFGKRRMRPVISLRFRCIERSGALEGRLREAALRLQRCHEGITQCDLTAEGGLDDRIDGAPFAVKIHLSVPGAQIHADSVHQDGVGHRDVYGALRDAYASARRQLQELKRDRKSRLLSGVRG